MATAVETYTWLAYQAKLRAYLETPTGYDAQLELWLAAAAQDCDDLIDNPFLDSEGEDIPHPAKIPFGIYEWIKAVLSYYIGVPIGRQSVKTGALQEVYAGGASGIQAYSLGRAAAHDLWQAAMLDITRIGKG